MRALLLGSDTPLGKALLQRNAVLGRHELLPMSRAQEWVDTLSPDEEIVFFCHHGMRSAQVANFFARQRAFPNVANMSGGIDAWSTQIDPGVPRY